MFGCLFFHLTSSFWISGLDECMAEAVDCLNDNTNRQSAATAELIVGQNALIAALQHRVGFLEDQLNQLEVRLDRALPPVRAVEVIDLTSDEDEVGSGRVTVFDIV